MRRRLGVWLAGVAFKIDPKLPEALVWVVMRELADADRDVERQLMRHRANIARIAQGN